MVIFLDDQQLSFCMVTTEN